MRTNKSVKAMAMALVVTLAAGAGAAQACVWNGYVCVPVCHVVYDTVWIQVGFAPGQGYWTTVARNVCR